MLVQSSAKHLSRTLQWANATFPPALSRERSYQTRLAPRRRKQLTNSNSARKWIFRTFLQRPPVNTTNKQSRLSRPFDLDLPRHARLLFPALVYEPRAARFEDLFIRWGRHHRNAAPVSPLPGAGGPPGRPFPGTRLPARSARPGSPHGRCLPGAASQRTPCAGLRRPPPCSC